MFCMFYVVIVILYVLLGEIKFTQKPVHGGVKHATKPHSPNGRDQHFLRRAQSI